MIIESVCPTSKTLPSLAILLAALALLASAVTFASAQVESSSATTTTASDVMLSLPDAPSFTRSSNIPIDDTASSSAEDTEDIDSPDPSDPDKAKARRHLYPASRRELTIWPGQTAPRLSAHDKVILGFRESVSLFSVVGWIGSTGYGQLVNGSPNYGTDSGAFGERLGANAIHGISHNIIGNSFFAPLFHEDPRYYKMGKGHNIVKRSGYALTRVFVTRSDDGLARPNYSLISGNIAGAALTNAYFPDANHGAAETAKIFGTSMVGSTVGFIVTEFLDDALQIVHLQKLE